MKRPLNAGNITAIHQHRVDLTTSPPAMTVTVSSPFYRYRSTHVNIVASLLVVALMKDFVPCIYGRPASAFLLINQHIHTTRKHRERYEYQKHSPVFKLRKYHQSRRGNRQKASATKSNENEEETAKQQMDAVTSIAPELSSLDSSVSILDGTTDEEMILACAAYLQRHRLLKDHEGNTTTALYDLNYVPLGWNDKLARDIQREEAAEDSSGYFWDRPQELLYLQKNSLGMTEEDIKKMVKDADVNEAADRESKGDGSDRDDTTAAAGYESTGLSDGYGFASFPQSPDATRIYRSTAAKKTWQDEEFRAKWYNARWGENYQLKETYARKVEERVQNLPPEMLRTSEFQSLTAEEIANAIRVYKSSNRKRSISHRVHNERIRNRKKMGGVRNHDKVDVNSSSAAAGVDTTDEPVIISFLPSEEEQRALRERRAEKSRKAYETRLKTLKAAEAAAPSPPPVPKESAVEWSWKDSASHAIYRVEMALDAERYPEIRDIELMMKRERLKDRRLIYRRIIKECLGLRGRCVYDPDLYGGDEGRDVELYFPTHCAIDLVGRFIVYKLKECNL